MKKWLVGAGIGCVAVGVLVAGCAAFFRTAAWLREDERAADVAPGEYVELESGDVHVQRWGPETGRVALLVPGTSAWAETWVEVAEPLADAGFRVVAIDLPPFGYSERPAEGAYTRVDQAERILGVLEQIGARDAVLVGHSFGGGPTVEAAMRAKEGRIGDLVLLAAALGLGAPPSTTGSLVVGPVAEVLASMTLSNPWFTQTGVELMIADPSAATKERVQRYRTPLVIEGTTHAMGTWLPELISPTPGKSSDEANYASLRLPTTIIWGELDTATPLSQAEHLHSLLPNSSLVVLPGVGHLPQIEDPAGVARAIEDCCSPSALHRDPPPRETSP